MRHCYTFVCVDILSRSLGFDLSIFSQISAQTAAASLLLQLEMQPKLLMLGFRLVLELQLTYSNCTSSQLLWSNLGLNVLHESFKGAGHAMKILNSQFSPSTSNSIEESIVLYDNYLNILKKTRGGWKSNLWSTYCINSNIEVPVLTRTLSSEILHWSQL
jgi:hypothetical protein